MKPSSREKSEFVGQPGCKEIQWLVRRVIFDECSRAEIDVAGEHGNMAGGSPRQRQGRRVPDEARRTPSRGTQKRPRQPINAVPQTLPPEKVPVERERHLIAEEDIERRMQVDDVLRANGIGEIEVD